MCSDCGTGMADILIFYVLGLFLTAPYAILRYMLSPADLPATTFLPLEMMRCRFPAAQLCHRPLPSTEHCAFCKAPAGIPGAVHCRSCGSPHHKECFRLHGGCSVYGCNGKTFQLVPRGTAKAAKIAKKKGSLILFPL